MSDADMAEAFATDKSLLALLFQLMAHKHLVDAALTLAQVRHCQRTAGPLNARGLARLPWSCALVFAPLVVPVRMTSWPSSLLLL